MWVMEEVVCYFSCVYIDYFESGCLMLMLVIDVVCVLVFICQVFEDQIKQVQVEIVEWFGDVDKVW